jgi:hypothetical protein
MKRGIHTSYSVPEIRQHVEEANESYPCREMLLAVEAVARRNHDAL